MVCSSELIHGPVQNNFRTGEALCHQRRVQYEPGHLQGSCLPSQINRKRSPLPTTTPIHPSHRWPTYLIQIEAITRMPYRRSGPGILHRLDLCNSLMVANTTSRAQIDPTPAHLWLASSFTEIRALPRTHMLGERLKVQYAFARSHTAKI